MLIEIVLMNFQLVYSHFLADLSIVFLVLLNFLNNQLHQRLLRKFILVFIILNYPSGLEDLLLKLTHLLVTDHDVAALVNIQIACFPMPKCALLELKLLQILVLIKDFFAFAVIFQKGINLVRQTYLLRNTLISDYSVYWLHQFFGGLLVLHRIRLCFRLLIQSVLE